MKILGIGVDILNNNRIKNLIKNKRFLIRTFGSKELKMSKKIFPELNCVRGVQKSLHERPGGGSRGNV